MPKYLILFRSHQDTFATMPPDQVQHFNQKWQSWWAQGEREGWLLDASKALKTEGRVITADLAVTDGPLVEGTDVVRGYINLQADSLDAAAELAKGCPVLQHGGRVEVRPFFETHPGE
jgi:hypothetical protein